MSSFYLPLRGPSCSVHTTDLKFLLFTIWDFCGRFTLVKSLPLLQRIIYVLEIDSSVSLDLNNSTVSLGLIMTKLIRYHNSCWTLYLTHTALFYPNTVCHKTRLCHFESSVNKLISNQQEVFYYTRVNSTSSSSIPCYLPKCKVVSINVDSVKMFYSTSPMVSIYDLSASYPTEICHLMKDYWAYLDPTWSGC